MRADLITYGASSRCRAPRTLALRLVTTVVRCADEVDAEIAADTAEEAAGQAWLRERQLLAGSP